jgi:hypothetical protein
MSAGLLPNIGLLSSIGAINHPVKRFSQGFSSSQTIKAMSAFGTRRCNILVAFGAVPSHEGRRLPFFIGFRLLPVCPTAVDPIKWR